ncbi:RES family NAD+ phosphorylase [Myxococcota bacterium]
MARKKKRQKRKVRSGRQRTKAKKPRPGGRVLDITSADAVVAYKKTTKKVLEFQWAFYSELAGQRKQVQDRLLAALTTAAVGPIERSGWQRAVRYKYSLHPLSAVGSLVSPVGGRFNIGDLDPVNFPPFPALYVAADRETAEQELLCQGNPEAGLTNHDFALTQASSISVVSVDMSLERCIDLRTTPSLHGFVDVVKTFELSSHLKKRARAVKFPEPALVTLPSQLRKSLLDPDWRASPARYDIPANSQLFGQLVYEAGIEGILYPSKMTKKEAIAIFPRNFANGESWIKIRDDLPHPDMVACIDATSYPLAEKKADELGITRASLPAAATNH